MSELQEAIVSKTEIRCPICQRLYAELQGGETIKNFRAFCKGRGKYTNGGHYFTINIENKKE